MIHGTEELNSENELLERLEVMTLIEPLPSQINQNLQDPLLYMGGYLNNKDLSAFSRSCHQTSLWTKQHMEFRAASTLLDLVVKGNQEGAMRILQSNPALLLNNKCTAVDYSGKHIKGLTAFQAALCARDVEMCMMMKECFNTVENGPELLKQQYNTIFPQGIEACSQEQRKEKFDFSDIIKAILNAPGDEVEEALNKQYDESKPLHKALSIFRAAFDKLSHGSEIFNPLNLHKVLTLYDDIFDDIQSWKRCDLLWRQVVGYTQRHLPACYAQALAQGVYSLVEKKEALQREFKYRLGQGVVVFPLGEAHALGFDFAVGLDDPWGHSRRCAVAAGVDEILEKLLQAKTSSLEQAFQPAEEPQLLVCSVLK